MTGVQPAAVRTSASAPTFTSTCTAPGLPLHHLPPHISSHLNCASLHSERAQVDGYREVEGSVALLPAALLEPLPSCQQPSCHLLILMQHSLPLSKQLRLPCFLLLTFCTATISTLLLSAVLQSTGTTFPSLPLPSSLGADSKRSTTR
eukprot:320136-Rhodomonas_salina.1